MPRKNPVPEDEVNICCRLKEARRAQSLTRVAFAKRIEVDSGFLANIESARAPLRYALGDKICRALNLNQRWLAEGKRPCYGYIRNEPAEGKMPSSELLFSEVYRARLADGIGMELQKSAALLKCKEEDLDEYIFPRNPSESNQAFTVAMLSLICGKLGDDVNMMPIALQKKLYAEMEGCFHEFLKKHVKKIVAPKVAAEAMKKWR